MLSRASAARYRSWRMSALPQKADMAPTARDAHHVRATSRYHNQLIPPPPHAIRIAPPIPNAQACRRALADCTEWDGAITSGAVSSPLVSAAVMTRSIAPPHHPALHTFSPSSSIPFSFRTHLYLAVTLTAQSSSSRSAKDPGNSGSFAQCRLRRCRHVPRGTAEFASLR